MKTEEGKNTKPGISRRSFLGTAATAATALTIIPRHVLGGRGYTAPSDLIHIAGIGMGNQGTADIRQICDPDVPIPDQPLPNLEWPMAPAWAGNESAPPAMIGNAGKDPIKLANVYAVCDVDSVYAARVFKGYPKAKVYTDWRELLDKEKSNIDAVLIATPDHLHAMIAAAFIREKKHVYVEKPMAKTVHEVRFLKDLAKQYNVVTQMGNQGHNTDGTRKTVEWIRSGIIGNVKEVYLSTDRPVWAQGNLKRPSGEKVPKTLNWDLFQGPAPEKAYSSKIVPFGWRGLWDYGTGALGDMGAHIFDAPIWALGLDLPVRIHASTTPFNEEYLPLAESITYEFAERPELKMPAVTVNWTDGGILPPRPVDLKPGQRIMEAVYVGDNGIIMHSSHGADPVLVSGFKDFNGVKPWLPRTKNIFEDWIDAIKNGTKAANDFEISGKLTEIMLLANIAVKMKFANQYLDYDAANMKITNLPKANELFQYEYRNGWKL